MSFVIKAGDGGPGQFILGDARGDAGEIPKAPRLPPLLFFGLDARQEGRRNVERHAITQVEFIRESMTAAAAGLNMSYLSRWRFLFFFLLSTVVNTVRRESGRKCHSFKYFIRGYSAADIIC